MVGGQPCIEGNLLRN